MPAITDGKRFTFWLGSLLSDIETGRDLNLAAGALKAGNLPASEIICRNILDRNPDCAQALNMLAIIASHVGATGHAVAYLESAAALEPGSATLERNLKRVRGQPHASHAPAVPRYLLIKAWGFGFWSDVSHVLGSLLLAEITGRTPVTHWGRNSLFHDDSGQDAFQFYFEPVSGFDLADLERIEDATHFPRKWNAANLRCDDVAKWNGDGSRAGALYFLNCTATIAVTDFYIGVINVMPWIPATHPMWKKPVQEVYRYLAEKYLRLSERCRSLCDEFFLRNLRNAPYLSVHMRGSDKGLEDGALSAAQQAVFSEIEHLAPEYGIFLQTDDETLLAEVRRRFGDRFVSTDSQRSRTAEGLHYSPTLDRVKAGIEVVVDTFLALRGNRFVGNGRSNVSAMIAMMKNWLPGHCRLVGSNLLLERNLFIYMVQHPDGRIAAT